MWETKVLNSLNLPALILSSPVRLWWERPIVIGKGFGVFTGDVAYLVAIFVFWWWIGKQIDDWSSREALAPSVYRKRRLFYGGVVILAIALTVLGVASLLPRFGKQFQFSVPAIIWGLSLVIVSAKLTRRMTLIA
jgi:hypothetical protein